MHFTPQKITFIGKEKSQEERDNHSDAKKVQLKWENKIRELKGTITSVKKENDRLKKLSKEIMLDVSIQKVL